RRHTRCYRDWSSDVCSSDLNNEQRLRGGGTDSETQRAIRAFEFPDGVPEEYYWVFPEEDRRRAGARRRTGMSVKEWVRLVSKERSEERRVGKGGGGRG